MQNEKIKWDQKSLEYGAYYAINRCSKIIEQLPDSGYNKQIVKEFENLKKKIEEHFKTF